VQSSSNS